MQRIVLSLMALCALALSVSLAMAAPEAPAQLKLEAPAGIKATKNPVDFPHGKHDKAGLECTTCHHTWDGAGDIKSCSTAGCHDQPGKKGETAYYAAFHAKKTDRSCLGCHKEKKKAGMTVPIGCKDCHPK